MSGGATGGGGARTGAGSAGAGGGGAAGGPPAGEPRPETRGLVEAAASEVNVSDLEKKGLDKVKVLRASDVDRMIQTAVANGLAERARDRDQALAKARKALEAEAAETQAREAEVRSAEAEVTRLRGATAELEAAVRGLHARLRPTEEAAAARRAANQEASRRNQELHDRLGRARAGSDQVRKAAADLAERNRTLRERLGTAEARAAREGAHALAARLDAAERRAAAAERRAKALARRIEEDEAQRAALASRPSGLELGKGLDVGTANLVSAMQDAQGEVHTALQRNAFLTIDADDFTRGMLSRLGVQYATLSGRMVVVGDAAFELAKVLNKETRRPMARGVLSPDEEDALPIMKLLIEKLLGPPQRPGEPCFYSVPAEPIDFSMNPVYHEKMFHGLLSRLGYEPRPLLEGHAVVLAEMADDEFTGIGISCGGGMHNVCVAFRAVNVLSFATARGGDWIDENVAQVLGVKRSKATAIKESGIDLRDPKGREQQAVGIYYRDLISYTLRNIKGRFESKADRPDFGKPVDIVFAGGTSLVGGFIDIVREELAKLAFPIPVREVRLAEDPLRAVARGCLVAALSGLDA